MRRAVSRRVAERGCTWKGGPAEASTPETGPPPSALSGEGPGVRFCMASRTSASTILPCGPVPLSEARSIPFSCANFLAMGDTLRGEGEMGREGDGENE